MKLGLCSRRTCKLLRFSIVGFLGRSPKACMRTVYGELSIQEVAESGRIWKAKLALAPAATGRRGAQRVDLYWVGKCYITPITIYFSDQNNPHLKIQLLRILTFEKARESSLPFGTVWWLLRYHVHCNSVCLGEEETQFLGWAVQSLALYGYEKYWQ